MAIDSDEIEAIYTKTIKPGKETEVVDGTGKYLIPGLWDMHVHNNWNYKDCNDLLLANGVTGAREMWGNMQVRKEMQEQIAPTNHGINDDGIKKEGDVEKIFFKKAPGILCSMAGSKPQHLSGHH